MNLKRTIIVSAVAVMSLITIAPAAHASNNCSGDGPVPTLYRKITGEELIHCL